LKYDLEFEQPLAEQASKIDMLRQEGDTSINTGRIQAAREELRVRRREIYGNLSAWETVLVARHKDRPRAIDFINLIADNFTELHGDRIFSDDRALIGGLATFNGETVMFLAHQKGRDAKEQQFRNFGMPHPEGYRKAFRLMQMAQKFKLPLICLIDTPGAFPALEDEGRGQAQAIAANLALMACLPVPIIAIVIGEGGSGGALGISVADCLLMLEHSVYTVAAPEAAASILWRDNCYAPQAANAMCISAYELLSTQIIDDVIFEPVGGAHADPYLAASYLQVAIKNYLSVLKQYSPEELLERRYQKFRAIGPFDYDTPPSVI
jgi:acetyl-CoA carboxylase carboxyl transferase subunit alpha